MLPLAHFPGSEAHVARLRTHWRRPDGSLATHFVGADCTDPTPLIADLGDTAPFLAAIGDTSAALDMARAADTHLVDGLFPRGRKTLLFDNHDLVLGWLDLHEQTGERWLLDRATTALERIARTFTVNGLLVDATGPLGLHSLRANPFNGGYIETAVDLHRLTGRREPLDWARTWARALVDSPWFVAHGMFSRFATPRLPALGTLLGRASRAGPVRLFKDNTNCAWGILSLHAVEPDAAWSGAIQRLLSALEAEFDRNGHMPAYPGRPSRFDLAAHVFLCDLLVDIALAGIEPDRATALALKLVQVVEQHRWPNGLVPASEGCERDHLDIMVDYGIALCRLGAWTGDPSLRTRALEGWAKTWAAHATPDGLVLGVSLDGGVRDARIIVKYQFLAVKSLLGAASPNLLHDEAAMRLVRDR